MNDKRRSISSVAEEESNYSGLEDEIKNISESNKEKSEHKEKKLKIIVNVYNTGYDVIKNVLKKKFGYRLSHAQNGEWDLLWADTGVTNTMLYHMKKYQKINHYPSMFCITRKNCLGKNLMKMRRQFPREYSFFPQTWILPSYWEEFKSQFDKGKCKTYLCC